MKEFCKHGHEYAVTGFTMMKPTVYGSIWKACNECRRIQARYHYHTKLDKTQRNKRNKERYATDPEYRAKLALETKSRYYRVSREENSRKRRVRRLKRQYGLSEEQWNIVFENQGRKCAACGSSGPKRKRGWHTDHDHKTGKFRGILCGGCNHALGATEDSIEILQGLISYLKYYVPKLAA